MPSFSGVLINQKTRQGTQDINLIRLLDTPEFNTVHTCTPIRIVLCKSFKDFHSIDPAISPEFVSSQAEKLIDYENPGPWINHLVSDEVQQTFVSFEFYP